MLRNRHIVLLFCCIAAILTLTTVQVVAQDEVQDPEACSEIVENAFVQLSEVCAGYGAGQVCIGSTNTAASFAEEVDEGFFTQPGDIADLSLVDSILMSPIDVNLATWGLSVVDSRASLPSEVVDSLSGKGAVYFLLGGIEVNEVTASEDLIVPLRQGIPTTTLKTADMRITPVEVDGAYSNVVGRIFPETALTADAITPDGEWVRVVFEGLPGWVRRSIFAEAEDFSGLVEIGPDNFTSMQAFDLSLNGDNGACVNTPQQNMLIQGPDGMAVDIQVSGLPVRVTSTILAIPLPNNRVRICTLSGVGIVYPDNDALRTIIPPGFCAEIDLLTGQFVTPDPFEGTNIAVMGDPAFVQWLNDLSQLLPSNLIHYTPEELSIDFASAVGDAQVIITYINVQQTNIVEDFCNAGILPANVCEVYIL